MTINILLLDAQRVAYVGCCTFTFRVLTSYRLPWLFRCNLHDCQQHIHAHVSLKLNACHNLKHTHTLRIFMHLRNICLKPSYVGIEYNLSNHFYIKVERVLYLYTRQLTVYTIIIIIIITIVTITTAQHHYKCRVISACAGFCFYFKICEAAAAAWP